MKNLNRLLGITFISLVSACSSVTVVNTPKTGVNWFVLLEEISVANMLMSQNGMMYPKEKNSRFVTIQYILINRTGQEAEYPLEKILLKNDTLSKQGVLFYRGILSNNFSAKKQYNLAITFEFPKHVDPTSLFFPDVGEIELKLVK